MYEYIPDELKKLSNWVCWQAVPDEAGGKIKKLPINPHTGDLARSNDPSTWSDFNTAVAASAGFAGIGFMFGNCEYFGVDIDGVGDEIAAFKTGENNIITEFITTLQSYTELSQSGKGIHIICKGNLPKQGRRRGNVEMYETGRFFVMTGKPCAEYMDINECTEAIKALHEKYIGGGREPSAVPRAYVPALPATANDIITLAGKAKNAPRFNALMQGDYSGYVSQSEADMALCNMLAFWCRCDADMMDCIYRQSGLMREKWDRRQSGSTYGAITIQKAIADCEKVYEPAQKSPQFTARFTGESSVVHAKLDTAQDEPVKLYTFDDTGNAERLIDLFGREIRYSYTDKRWLYYDGRKWCYDNSGTIERIADKAVLAMKAEAKAYEQMDAEDGGDMAKSFEKHLKSSRSNKSKSAMLKEAQHHVPIVPAQMDKYKMVLNTPSGVLDLKSGTLSEHKPEAYFTRITSAEYTSNADCPQWLKFLDEIFGGDKDLIRYVQKAVGYSLTGSTAEQCVFFLFGTGRNGKSTFLDIIRAIMGDYASNIQPETIMVRSNQSSAINSDIARLKGARFVTSVEPNEGVRINEGLLKQLTGDDIVTARKLYGDEFEFKPEFKLWMATNHKPIIRGTDTGIWRRVHMIPFTVQIPEEKKDPRLKYKLCRELPAIFRWAVEGCILYQAEGLHMPKAVVAMVKEYRREMDVISAFVEDRCTEGKDCYAQANVLYAAYAQWCDDNNEYKMSNTKFGIELAKRFPKTSSRRGNTNAKFYIGISLDG